MPPDAGFTEGKDDAVSLVELGADIVTSQILATGNYCEVQALWTVTGEWRGVGEHGRDRYNVPQLARHIHCV